MSPPPARRRTPPTPTHHADTRTPTVSSVTRAPAANEPEHPDVTVDLRKPWANGIWVLVTVTKALREAGHDPEPFHRAALPWAYEAHDGKTPDSSTGRTSLDTALEAARRFVVVRT